MNRVRRQLLTIAFACLATVGANAASPLYEGPLVEGLEFTENIESGTEVDATIHRWRPSSSSLPFLWAVDLGLVQQDMVFTGVGSMDTAEATALARVFFREGEIEPQSGQIELDAGYLNFRLMRLRLGTRASCVVFRRFSANNMVDEQETEDGNYGMGQRKLYGLYCAAGTAMPLSDDVLRRLVDGLRPKS